MQRAVFLFIRLLPLITIFSYLSVRDTCAQELRFNSEITSTYSDSKSELRTTGQEINSNGYTVEQRYNLNFSKSIYPYLIFNAGMFFDWNNSHFEADGTDSDLEERTLRPSVGLRLTNPVYQAGIEYRRTEINDVNPDTTNTESIRDEVETILGWRPLNLPHVSLRYNYTHSYDNPETVDTIENFLEVASNYTLWRELRLDYNYTRDDTKNRTNNFDTLEQTHFGRINYAHGFWNGRLLLNSGYNIRYNTFEFPGGSTGTSEISLQRSQGLFELDNTPADGELTQQVPALIDGNLTASTGINLGTNGNQTTLANIGLDFGVEVNVDQIRLWVDRSLSNAVADSFSWSIYVSPDNNPLSTWTLVATVFPAAFGTFENRFTMFFPTVNTRYIKVVTSALSPLVPGASNFSDILVTEMQAFATVSGANVQNKITNTDQNFDFGLRARLTEKTSAGYILNYISREQDPADIKDTQLTNTIYMNHIFNRIFSAGSRLERTDTSQGDEDRTSHAYSAFMKGSYLPNFDQTLTFSGENTKEEDDSSDVYSLVLRNNAILYRGWSAFLDSGLNYNRPTRSDEVEKSLLLRVSTNFEPNQMLSFNLDYRLREIYEPEKTTQADLNIQAFFVPTRTLSLNASFSLSKRPNRKSQTFQNYVVSWSPSPDGDLQFILTYNETLQSESNRRQTSLGPSVNWTISRHFFMEVSYSYIKEKSDTLKIETNSVFARLRMNF